MGIKRGLIATEGAKNQLDVIYESDYFGKTGLIVGQRTFGGASGDYAVFFARTPADADDGDASFAKDLLSDVTWMTEHVKQVSRMLPGGLCVLGVVAVEPEISGPKKLAVEKILKFCAQNQLKTGFSCDPDNTFYVMNVDRTSKTTTVTSVDVSTMTWKSGHFRVEEKSGSHWQVVKSNFLLDNSFFFPSESEFDMRQKFERVLEKVERSLREATILFDSTFRKAEKGEILNTDVKRVAVKKGKGKSSTKKEVEMEPEKLEKKVYRAEILLDDVSDDEEEIKTVESSSRMRVSGKMTVRVFLHPEATVEEAEAAIKEDVYRTLAARLDIHIDSLDSEDKNEIPEEVHRPGTVVHEPPRRCLIRLPNFKKRSSDDEEEEENEDDIAVSDFLFPGETPYESIESVKEVFGFIPSIETMDDDQELVASPQQMIPPPPPGSVSVPAEDLEAAKRNRARKFNMMAFVLSGIVLLIGMSISYFSIGGNDLEVSIDEAGKAREDGGPLPSN